MVDSIFAGFWRRTAAFVLDYLIIAVYIGILTALSLAINAAAPLLIPALFSDPISGQLTVFLILTLPVVLYFSLSESSFHHATWGKRWLGLKVSAPNGDRLTFGRALLRSAVKFLPWELSHTALWRIPGWPAQPSEPPLAASIFFALAWLMIIANVISLVLSHRRQTIYDHVAGSIVTRKV